MGPIERVVRYTRRIEAILVNQFGAQGNGISEMLSSIETKIPADLQRSLRSIARERNRLVHTDGAEIEDIESFARECENTIAALEILLRPKVSTRTEPFPGCFFALGLGALILAGLFIFILLIILVLFAFWMSVK